MGRSDARIEEARRGLADHPAMHGTRLDVGEKADGHAHRSVYGHWRSN